MQLSLPPPPPRELSRLFFLRYNACSLVLLKLCNYVFNCLTYYRTDTAVNGFPVIFFFYSNGIYLVNLSSDDYTRSSFSINPFTANHDYSHIHLVLLADD